MKKKYQALLCAILAGWIAVFFLYGEKSYMNTVRQIVSTIAVKPLQVLKRDTGNKDEDVSKKTVQEPAQQSAGLSQQAEQTGEAKSPAKTVTSAKEKTTKAAKETKKAETDEKSKADAGKKAEAETKTAGKTETASKKSTGKKAATHEKETTTEKAAKAAAPVATTPQITTTVPPKPTADTTAASTTAQATTLPAESGSRTTSGTLDAFASYSDAEFTSDRSLKSLAVKTVLNAMKRVQNEKKDFSVRQTKIYDLEVLACSEEPLRQAIENIVKTYVGETETMYNFQSGVATDSLGNTVTAADILPPAYSEFSPTYYNISSVAKQTVKNGVEWLLTIGKETTDMATVPGNHACTVGYIDFSKLDTAPLELEQATVVYKRSLLSAVTDSKGKTLHSLTTIVPIELHISGEMGTHVEFTVSGIMETNYKIYA